MHGPRLLFVCATVALTSLGAACDKPSSVTFEPADPISITSLDGATLPDVVVKSRKGKRVQGGPAPSLTIEPEGVVAFENGKLVPKKNGDATVMAVVAGLPPATLPVKVDIIDDVRLTCANPCSVAVGGRVLIGASASGFGQTAERPLTWESASPNVATVDDKGTVTGVAAGTASIKASAGGKSATLDVVVHAPLSELRMFCPSPPFVVVAKNVDGPVPPGQGPIPAPPGVNCELSEGESTHLLLQGADGLNTSTPSATWSSSAPSQVLVIDGDIRANSTGTATISAVVADLKTEMPILVKPAKSGAQQCTDPLGYGIDASVAYKIERDGATAAAAKLDYQCASPAAAECVKGAVPDVEKGGATAPAALVATLANHALSEAAKRCCCKPKLVLPSP